MKDFEINFIEKLVEQSEAGNLRWNVENIGGHNRLFRCVFSDEDTYTVLLTTPTVASPRAQLGIQVEGRFDNEPMVLVGVDTKTPMLSKEEIALLVSLKDSAIQYVKVVKEDLRLQKIANGVKLLDSRKYQS